MERLKINFFRARLRAVAWSVPLVLLGTAAAQEPKRISPAAALKNVATREEPQYPPMARGMGLNGVVAIDVVIDERGKVVEVEMVEGHPVLAHAAERALVHWRFNPIRIEGEPTKVITRLSFRFAP